MHLIGRKASNYTFSVFNFNMLLICLEHNVNELVVVIIVIITYICNWSSQFAQHTTIMNSSFFLYLFIVQVFLLYWLHLKANRFYLEMTLFLINCKHTRNSYLLFDSSKWTEYNLTSVCIKSNGERERKKEKIIYIEI